MTSIHIVKNFIKMKEIEDNKKISTKNNSLFTTFKRINMILKHLNPSKFNIN